LSTRATESLEGHEELSVLEPQLIFVVPPDGLPIGSPAKNDASIEPCDLKQSDRGERSERNTGRHAVVPDAGCSHDDPIGRQGPFDRVEGIRVDLRIGVDEGEDLTRSNPCTTIPRGCNGAFLNANDAAATCARNVGCTVGRCVIRHDDLDLIGPPLVSLPRQVDALEQLRKVVFFVERRNDE
jgi:hypothetical protein